MSLRLLEAPSSALLAYLNTTLSQSEKIDSEPKARKNLRNTLKVATGALAIAGTIPFVSISMKMAGSYKTLGVLFSIGNVAANSARNVWAYFKIIDASFAASPEKAYVQMENANLKWKKTALNIVAFLGGSLAQVPLAYLAYAYNQNSIPLFLLTALSGVAIPTYSLSCSFDELIRRKTLTDFEKKLSRVQGNLAALFDKNHQALLSLSPTEQLAMNKERLIEQLFSATRQEDSVEPSRLFRAGDYSAMCIGGALAIARLFLLFVISYHASVQIWDNAAFDASLATFVVLSNAYINGDFLIKTCRRMNEVAFHYFTNTKDPQVASVLRPKLTLGLQIAVILLDVLSLAPAIQVPIDYFSSNYILTMQIATVMGSFPTFLYAMLDLADDIALLPCSCINDKEQKDLLLFHRKLLEIRQTLRSSSLFAIADFLHVMSPEKKQALLDSCEMTHESLTSYIAEQQGHSAALLLEEELATPVSSPFNRSVLQGMSGAI